MVLIVDELESLWDRVILDWIHKCQYEKEICVALKLITCDIPAVRKICKHVLTLALCYRYEKQANYKDSYYNFTKMNDMDK